MFCLVVLLSIWRREEAAIHKKNWSFLYFKKDQLQIYIESVSYESLEEDVMGSWNVYVYVRFMSVYIKTYCMVWLVSLFLVLFFNGRNEIKCSFWEGDKSLTVENIRRWRRRVGETGQTWWPWLWTRRLSSSSLFFRMHFWLPRVIYSCSINLDKYMIPKHLGESFLSCLLWTMVLAFLSYLLVSRCLFCEFAGSPALISEKVVGFALWRSVSNV